MEQSVDRGKRGPEHMFYFELRACNLGNTKVLLDWLEERKKKSRKEEEKKKKERRDKLTS